MNDPLTILLVKYYLARVDNRFFGGGEESDKVLADAHKAIKDYIASAVAQAHADGYQEGVRDERNSAALRAFAQRGNIV